MPTKATFRYLNDSEHCWRENEPKVCVVCGQSRLGYGLLDDREDDYDIYHVCEPCILSERLAKKNLRVNDGDVDGLLAQLREVRPELREDERQAIATERTTKVEQRTPRRAILNLFTWSAHCGDCMVFYHQVDIDDLNRIASHGDDPAF